ncbi:GNAT family N-acetyltransferase [Helcobacillus massiliensis]|uniref:GNAT family N-acetyltransferase n=1 Tax=Helcobacillus massiliensis TaxID=521392 RepID=UPI0021A4A9B0|nr:GNAT family protein [Helcobacillus massiliensis]MCT1558759.1 GNAT family N-acetyltransferase [Helcobacillus massiliensis]MCT2037517.1 GNAT family N-acetyltransferase [Helcobacillus massiliensis]
MREPGGPAAQSPADAGAPRHEPRVELRPLRRRDRRAFIRLRDQNWEWLRLWEAVDPSADAPASSAAVFRSLRRSDRLGSTATLAVEVEGRLTGLVMIGPMMWGAVSTAPIGYWIEESAAGCGVMTRALRLALDYCFEDLALHRVTAQIQPSNTASLRVAHKVGLRREGLLTGSMHVNGAWRDHLLLAVTAEEHRPLNP